VAVAAVVLVVIGVVALALRSRDSHTRSPQATSSAPPTDVRGEPSSGSPGPPRCTTSDLDIAFRDVEGGLGHGGVVLVFTNKSALCMIVGFPGVGGLASDGRHVVSAKRTPNGYLGGPQGDAPAVTLAPGKSASALLEGENGTVDGMGPCPAYSSFAIIAPDDTTVAVLPWRSPQNPICYPQIHPVVAGDTGDAFTPS
jgi:hypothetical protein